MLKIEKVSHNFGNHNVLHDINLEINAGEFVAIVGPSGCGKSTLLKGIVGTHPPSNGKIIIDGYCIEKPCKDVGIVYQDYALYDFLTAQKNVAFGPMLHETNFAYRNFKILSWLKLRKKHLCEATEILTKFGLGNAIKKYPTQMSGGMRQRVAVAQSLIMKPKILLLDEPFGALDESTREEMQLTLLNMYQENLQAKENGKIPPYTIVIVTHQLDEAIYVSNRVVVLSQYWSKNDSCNGKNLGATICYNKEAPIYHPNDEVNFETFAQQRQEIREAIGG